MVIPIVDCSLRKLPLRINEFNQYVRFYCHRIYEETSQASMKLFEMVSGENITSGVSDLRRRYIPSYSRSVTLVERFEQFRVHNSTWNTLLSVNS